MPHARARSGAIQEARSPIDPSRLFRSMLSRIGDPILTSLVGTGSRYAWGRRNGRDRHLANEALSGG